ncbi:YggS family pyridoxal phosphate-dependent enzyme [Cardiobacterium valvarum]|uniref:Pyridoxal phosphate homeostasis protein n=1 Tax=Cardiobacterium valvarum TaxID=194702 RepID=A0A381DZ07_9GAMM|nr:YggS family pyridoxal phosphate-dependent enzyme [Cardiobacterium valvarum]SUX18497.1 Predicted enzyme with a TIM-barrel fold [Cardiobacterium valvarum]
MPAPLYPQATTAAEITANLAHINARIAAACAACGRDAASVRLLPVSKTVPAERLHYAYEAGIRLLGENKVQEAYDKWQALADLDGLNWAVIGHLQSNKVKYVARFATEFQALDSLEIAESLDRRLQQEGRRLDVFVQVNTSDEPQKYGIAPDEAEAFIRALPQYNSLRLRGLMTLALFSDDKDAVRRCFIRLRELRDCLQQQNPAVAELSMGMSGDFELAIAEGATTVRVGQAIFGARRTPDSEYWPGLVPGGH